MKFALLTMMRIYGCIGSITKNLKKLELRYRHYDLAQDWIRRNQNYFFSVI